MDRRVNIDNVQPSARHHRRGAQPDAIGAAGNLDAPGGRDAGGQGDMTHRLHRVAARLRPVGIDRFARQGHRNIGQRRIDFDRAFARQDVDPIAKRRRVGLAFLEYAAAAQ